jgi:hypothetical protein
MGKVKSLISYTLHEFLDFAPDMILTVLLKEKISFLL